MKNESRIYNKTKSKKLYCDMKLMEYEGGFTYFEGCEFIYYSHPDIIRGLRAEGIITYGTHYTRKDIDYEYLKLCVNYKQ